MPSIVPPSSYRPLQSLCSPAAHCTAAAYCRCRHSIGIMPPPSIMIAAAVHLALPPRAPLLCWQQLSAAYCVGHCAATVPLLIVIALSSYHPLHRCCPSLLLLSIVIMPPPSIMIATTTTYHPSCPSSHCAASASEAIIRHTLCRLSHSPRPIAHCNHSAIPPPIVPPLLIIAVAIHCNLAAAVHYDCH